MTSRERMLTAIDRTGLPDRVPLDIWATPEVWAKLRAHFAVADNQAVQRALRIDGFHHVGPRYIGPPLPRSADGVVANEWGMRSKPVAYGSGTYLEQFHYPLAEVKSVSELDDYPWPRADWWDYSTIRAQCEAGRDKAIKGGYFAPFFFFNKLRGLEQSLLDLALDAELSHAIIARVTDVFYAQAERLFEAAGGLLDVAELTDDFGAQHGLLISEAMWDEYFAAPYARLAGLFAAHGVRLFHHDDGAMWPLIPRLLDLGMAVLNPLQLNCGPMDPGWLKAAYGDRLCFHGGIDNQAVLAFGSVDDVIAETRRCLAALAPGGGYVLAPCHNLQPVTPVENILAMYETAWTEGVYRS